MVFTPKTKAKLEGWTLDPDLPEVRYKADGRLNLTALARDISEKLPVKTFRDRVEFDDVVGQIFSQVWPKWEDYFSPLVRKPFDRDVHKAVFDYAKVELADEKKGEKKNDSKPDTKRFFKTDGT